MFSYKNTTLLALTLVFHTCFVDRTSVFFVQRHERWLKDISKISVYTQNYTSCSGYLLPVGLLILSILRNKNDRHYDKLCFPLVLCKCAPNQYFLHVGNVNMTHNLSESKRGKREKPLTNVSKIEKQTFLRHLIYLTHHLCCIPIRSGAE